MTDLGGSASRAVRPLAPVGWRLRADRSLRVAAADAAVYGGTPLRVMRLQSAGLELVTGWLGGEPIGTAAVERAFARRLLDAGLVHPEPPDVSDLEELTVVVPVRDRPQQLRRCLASVAGGCRMIVVDDHSQDSAAIAVVAQEHDARIVVLDRPSGPSAARNAGMAVASTALVAFVDSDCILPFGVLHRLVSHLADPAVVVAVPRIVAHAGEGGRLDSYEQRRSSLDMGLHEGLVAPGSPIPYAPSATLVARVRDLGAGFDEGLRVGEDVDLVWRLHREGRQVRYDPSARVAHDHRVRLGPWFARRVIYNSSTAPLALRHSHAVAALDLTRAGAAGWLLLLVGRPRAAALVSAAPAALLARRLRGRVPRSSAVAVRVVARGRLHEARHLSRALTGPWMPLALLAGALSPPVRHRIALIVMAGAALERREGREEAAPAHLVVVAAAAAAARCLGIWTGCARHRTLRPLRLRVR